MKLFSMIAKLNAYTITEWDSSCFIEIIVLNSIIKGGVGRVRVPSECFRGMERGQE